MMGRFLKSRIVTARFATLLFICLASTGLCLIIISWSNSISTQHSDKIDTDVYAKDKPSGRRLEKKIIGEIRAKDNKTVRPLLTLFTTFDLSSEKPYKTIAHQEAIENWSTFMPTIQPVLFHTAADHPLVKMAANAKWDLIKLTSINAYGTPKLKPMFTTIFQKYDSSFYGFANGDILFCGNLVRTLRAVEQNLERLKNNVLVIGQRKNAYMNSKQSSDTYSRKNIAKLGRNISTFLSEAIDYFMFSRDNSLNWTALADVVIGRPAYDNYLVGMSLKAGVNVIDASRTLLALHLSAPGSRFEGSKNADGSYNRQVIGQFRYASGATVRTKLRTIYDVFRDIFVIRRR